MISLVLYGRNDNYGYNLHKRAAISFNCMAELLTDADDEILFVDYNTPDDMPSFVEAILDTLTDQARRKIRVLRVRPSYHQRWRDKTHLNALESVSRNIAIRRSNPNNRWILSTNTDMVFVARGKKPSLTDAVRDLPRGYYGIPRFEMPESLWESLDRKDPRKIIASFAEWGNSLHLDEVVHSHKSIIYDGPGDFQLVPREDMFKIHGFSEAMLRGWHVDSNFAKRCLLLYGETKSLFHRVSGYHCDHTKVVSPLHGHDRTQNDMVEHITNVTAPQIPGQAEDWGAPDEKIEELRFPPGCSVGFAGAIAPLLGPMPVAHYEATYTEKTWNQFTYHARHALPYLADHLVTLPRDIDIGYAGINDTLRTLLAEAWRALGFTGRLLVLDQTAGDKPGCAPAPETDAPYTVADIDHIEAHAHLFILDLGTEEGPHWVNRIMNPERNPQAKALMPYVKSVQGAGLTLVARERRRLAQRLPPRRFIFVNTIGGELLGQIDFVVGQTATPYCTHARHGTVKPDPVDTLAQRRADADRLAAAIADELVATARQFLPIQFLDRVEPAALLSDAQRAEIAAEIPKRDKIQPWTPIAALMLGRFEPDFEQRIEAFLTLSPAEPQVFLQRLNMFRTAALEGMSRPWPPALAAALDRCAARFLDASRTLPEDVQLRGYAGFLALCNGAPGESLAGLAGRLLTYAEARAVGLSAGSSAFDAWLALDMADAITRRPGTDAARVQQGLTAPALAQIHEPRSAAAPGGNRYKVALIAAAPYGNAVDPAAGLVAGAVGGLLARDASPDTIIVVPLAPPDQAFRSAMHRVGVAVAPEIEAPAPGFVGLMARALKTVQAIREANPATALAIGGDALSLAILAKGVAPAQAAIGNRLAFAGAPGIDALLAADSLDGWLDQAAAARPAGGGSVHAAAD